MSRKIPRPRTGEKKCFPAEGELSAQPTEEVSRACRDRATLGFPQGKLSSEARLMRRGGRMTRG